MRGRMRVIAGVVAATVALTTATALAAPPEPIETSDAPSASIDSGPSGAVTKNTAAFTFSAADGADADTVVFECKLDDGTWEGCTSPRDYTALSNASHTFSVRALDAAGNVADPEPATRTWVVHVDRLETSIDSGPEGVVANSEATFTFEGTDTLSTVAVWGGGSGFGDGAITQPYSIAIAANGDVLVADRAHDRVQRFDTDGNYISQFGISGSGEGEFHSPYGIAVAPEGDIYVTDGENNRVQRFNDDGTFVSEWGNAGSGNGEFDSPRGIAIGSAGKIFVTDVYNHRIQKFAPNGDWLASWGHNGHGDGQFSYPFGVAVNDGSVYVADYNNSRIQRFDAAGNFLGKWGVYGTGDGQLRYPYGVTTDASGLVYVADTYNDRVQVFDAEGAYLWQFETARTKDGDEHLLYNAAITPEGDVFIADLSSDRIRKLSPAVQAFECSLDGADFSRCTSPAVYPGLTDGEHTFEVRAIDSKDAPDPTPAVRSWTVDTTGPTTTIASGPDDPIRSPEAEFTFEAADEPLAADDGAVEPAAELAVEPAAELAAEPVTEPAPVVEPIAADEPAEGADVPEEPAAIPTDDPAEVTADDAAEALPAFECQLDEGDWAECASPASFEGLLEGPHTFQVRASDELGNLGEVASYPWTVLPPDITPPSAAPTQEPAPNEAGWSNTDVVVTWNWSDDETGIDPNPDTCATSTTSTGEGEAISVTATCTDLAGNFGSATYSLNVDLTAPTAFITPGVDLTNPTASAKADFTVFGDDGAGSGVAMLRCRLDGGDWEKCPAENLAYTELTDGSHTLEVRAIDLAGNVGEPAVYTWLIEPLPTVEP